MRSANASSPPFSTNPIISRGAGRKPDSLPDLKSLGTLYLPTQTDTTGQVPLSGMPISRSQGALVVSHLAQFPAVTVSFNIAQDASLSKAADEIEQAERAVKLPP